MDLNHNIWAINRVNFIRSIFGDEYFQDKTLLELGSLHSFIGNEFHKLGCKVTCVEGRQSNIDTARNNYPYLNYICADLDKEEWNFGDYDIILHMGLLYHQANPEYLLKECKKHCNILILESEVVDSNNKTLTIKPSNEWFCQGLNKECEISVGYIESIIKSFQSTHRYDSALLNSEYHCYNWQEKNDNSYKLGQRRFWVCRN